MLTKFTYKRLTWIDLESPTKDEVREVMERYDIHPLVAEELLGETRKPKVDYYGNQIYLVLHFPTVTHSHQGRASQEVDFVIGRNFLITTHYGTVDPLLEFSKMFEVNSVLEKSNMGEHAGFLFFYIMRELYKNMADELNVIQKMLEDIEERIFSGDERLMVETISKVNHKLINFKQAIRFHKDVLSSFEVAAKDLFGEKFGFYASSISGEDSELHNILEGHKEMLTDLWNTNDSLLTTKTNEIMRVLTTMAFIILPMTFITQILGISYPSILPFMNTLPQFLLVVAGILLVGLITLFIFKGKKWL